MRYVATTKNLRTLSEAAIAYGLEPWNETDTAGRVMVRLITDKRYNTVMLDLGGCVFAPPASFNEEAADTRAFDFYLTCGELLALIEARDKSVLEKVYSTLRIKKREAVRKYLRPTWEKVKAYWKKLFALPPSVKRKAVHARQKAQAVSRARPSIYQYRYPTAEPREDDEQVMKVDVQGEINRLRDDYGEEEAQKVQEVLEKLSKLRTDDGELRNVLFRLSKALNSLVWLHDQIEDPAVPEDERKTVSQLLAIGRDAGWNVEAEPGMKTIEIEKSGEPWRLVAKRNVMRKAK